HCFLYLSEALVILTHQARGLCLIVYVNSGGRIELARSIELRSPLGDARGNEQEQTIPIVSGSVVRAQGNRTLEFLLRLAPLPLHHLHESERGMGFCLLLIESERFERRLLGSSVIFLRRREGVPGEGSVCVGQAGVGE